MSVGLAVSCRCQGTRECEAATGGVEGRQEKGAVRGEWEWWDDGVALVSMGQTAILGSIVMKTRI